MSIETLSLLLMLLGIALAFFNIRLSGWILGWILLSGALLLQGFRSVLSYIATHGNVDPTTYAIANDWMGLGFSLLVVAAMPMMRDVFARHKQTTESLRIISASANDAILIMDNKGAIAAWNLAAQDMFGYSEQEAQGRKLVDLIVPQRERANFQSMFDQFGRDGRGYLGSGPREFTGLRKDGTEIVTEYSISRVIVDNKWRAIYIVRDVTARKQAEEAARNRTATLEMLSAKMLSGDEREKKKLAFDLHEQLAQTLVTIKMLIESKLPQRGANDTRNGTLASLIPLLQYAIDDVQAIATGLRPSSLDELGLLPTLEWFCRQFERRHQMSITTDAVLVAEDDVPAPLKIVIYRIVESAFASIARYENTDKIGLGLQSIDGAIVLTIEDTSQDSRYSPAAERGTDAELHVHFAEARERAALSGGNVTIARNKAGAVTVRASWAG